MTLDRATLARKICERLDSQQDDIRRQWQGTNPVQHFVIDDLLPEEWTREIRAAFPDGRSMKLNQSLRERKYIAAQMNKYPPVLEEAIYAFQLPEVVQRIERLTEIKALEPDDMLYAGGISMMAPGHFLNPHIDNSHDKFRQRYRVLNLLFYVSPNWDQSRGCNLELWQTGPEGKPTTVISKFNRLVVMITRRNSWHSVSQNVSNEDRCCVSNYYFSKQPLGGTDYYHVTSFRGRPEQPLRDVVLRADNWLRTKIRTRFPGLFKNPHFYDRQRP